MEEREVGPRVHAAGSRPAGLLGAQRLSRVWRPVERTKILGKLKVYFRACRRWYGPWCERRLSQSGSMRRIISGAVSCPSYLEPRMVTRILNSAVFVLAVGCAALLPGRLLAQGEGSRAVQLQPAAAEEGASADPRVSSLAPKAQKAIGKAFEGLGSNMTLTAQGATKVRNHLETAYRVAPTSAEVSYLFGVYWLQMNDRAQAKSYWKKTIELYPHHYRALISLGQSLVDENKLGEALPYLERAVQAEPSFWRAHAIYADLYLRQGFPEEAVKHAERALQLGHGDAAVVQRYLAAALAKRGEKDKAVSVLQAYVQDNHGDTAAKKQLERLQLPETENPRDAAETSSQDMVEPWTLDGITALPLPTSWLPPDTDKKVPPVELGTGGTFLSVSGGNQLVGRGSAVIPSRVHGSTMSWLDVSAASRGFSVSGNCSLSSCFFAAVSP